MPQEAKAMTNTYNSIQLHQIVSITVEDAYQLTTGTYCVGITLCDDNGNETQISAFSDRKENLTLKCSGNADETA